MLKFFVIMTALLLAPGGQTARGGDLRFAPQVAVPATFTFKAHAEISGDRVLLKDLAACAGEAVICAEAGGVDLGPAPLPGKSDHYTRDKLLALLAQEWDEAAIQVVAPQGVRVSSAEIEVSADELETEMRRFLGAEYPEADHPPKVGATRVELVKLSVTGKHKLRPGEHRTEFPQFAKLALRNQDWLLKNAFGSQHVEVRYVPVEDPEAYETYSALATLAVKRWLPVAARSLAAGAMIQTADLEFGWVDQVRGAPKYCDEKAEALGHKLKRPLSIGVPVALNQLEIPLIVRRGQMLKLTMSSGGLTVTGRVKSMGEGSYGQAIDAIYPATKKHMRVRIVDASTVEYLE